jgi:hypothetical protein
LTGLPFWTLTLIFIIITLIVVFLRQNKNRKSTSAIKGGFNGFLFREWKPWLAGIAIGILVIPAYLSSIESGRNYPLGVTHGVLHVQLLATDNNLKHIWQKEPIINSGTQSKESIAKSESALNPKSKKVSWWLILLVSSLVAGSWYSAKLTNNLKLRPKPPEQTIVAFLGGILVGAGAAFATGCVIGNIISGWALMSVGLFVFGIVTIIMNWITTYFYLMGGTIFHRK